jgi:large subunit ribosomal protein L21e|tara:strand:- start:67 stop:345 length:279 start_codon:yes stop_codon:yes gene_type:complete
MARHHGYRTKTRSVLSGKKRAGISNFLIDYKVGDKVVIDIEPSQVKGMPHRRFQGLVGQISEVMSRSVEIELVVGKKLKKIKARLEHIKPQN